MSKNISRRTFVKQSLATAGAVSVFAISGTAASGRILGANDRVRVGVAGVKGRGRSHISEFGKMNNVEIAALIDPDLTVLNTQLGETEKAFGYKPQGYQDLRKALETKDLDVVSIATCNHTHALLAIWSVQAGKDVYVEKPCSHNLFEGRKLFEAAEKYGRIVQHGTQSRSSDARAKLIAAAQSGKYGKLVLAKGYCCKPRWTIGYKPIEQPPTTLDFDVWLGPAPKQPYHQNLVHYNWHWFWDMGNGDVGNQGVHEMDLCRWGIDQDWPKSVISFGARYVDEPEHGFRDQGQTPNMQLVLYEFDDCMLLFETRGLVGGKTETAKKWAPRVDVEFYTDRGVLREESFFPNGSTEAVAIEVDYKKPNPGGHFGNFMNCVRSRDRGQLNADIAVAHPSAALCQFGNIPHRLGRTASVDSIRSAFGDNAVVQQGIDAVVGNLADALPDLKNPEWVLGPKLAFDGGKRQFVANPEADKYLTREYRAPFVVPENV